MSFLSRTPWCAAFVALVFAAISPKPCQAQSASWVGGSSNSWFDSANWNPNGVPGTGDIATFDATSLNTTVSLGGGVTVNRIVFDSLAAPYIIGNGGPNSELLTLDNAGAITMNAPVASNQQFNSSLMLGSGGASTFTVTNNSTTNSLAFAGGIFASAGAGTRTLAFAGTGAINVDGSIDNGGGVVALTKTGVGVLTLNGVSTFSGGIIINGSGEVAVGNDFAAGSGAINFNTTGGTFRSADASPRTLTNPLTFSVSFTFGSATTGNLILTGNMNMGSATTTKTFIVNNAVTEFGGIMSGSGTGVRAKGGNGVLVLSGSNAFTNPFTLSSGTLRLDYSINDNSKLSNTVALTLSGGTLELAGGTHTEIVSATTVSSNVVNTITRSSGSAVLQMGAITIGAAPYLLNFTEEGIATTNTLNNNGILGFYTRVPSGGMSYFATNSTNSANGPITAFTAYTDITRLSGVVPNEATANIRIVNGGAPGNITLTASPINQIYSLRSEADAGPATIAFASTTDTLMVGSSTSGAIWQTAGAGALTIGTAPDDGILTSGATLFLINDSTTNSLTVNAAVAGNPAALAVIKVGAGTAVFNGSNTYTGMTSVANGTLTLAGNRTLDAGRIDVGTATDNATLNIQNGTFNFTADLRAGQSTTPGVVGTINQTGGNISFVNVANPQLIIGGLVSTGEYNLSGGTLTGIPDTIRGILIATNSNSNGTFNLSGNGVLDMSASNVQIARSDSAQVNTTATFNQTGGTATIGTLTIGGGLAGNTNARGTLNLTGGSFTALAFTALGVGNSSTTDIFIAGTSNVTLPEFPTLRGVNAVSRITFDGGTLFPLAPSANYISNMTSATATTNGAVFNVASGNDIAIPQVISNAASQNGTLTKLGDGSLGLTGANTYTGATSVQAGILAVGIGGSGSVISNVNVDNTAELKGTGTITGAVVVGPTAFIGPGDFAAGTLTVAAMGVTLQSGAVYRFAIDNAGPVASSPNDGSSTNAGSSQIAVATTGSFTAADMNLRVIEGGSFSAMFDPSMPYSWSVVTVAGSGGSLTLTGAAPTVDVNAIDAPTLFAAVTAGGSLTLDNTGSGVLNLNFVPVPEPTSLLLLAAIAFGSITPRRSHRAA